MHCAHICWSTSESCLPPSRCNASRNIGGCTRQSSQLSSTILSFDDSLRWQHRSLTRSLAGSQDAAALLAAGLLGNPPTQHFRQHTTTPLPFFASSSSSAPSPDLQALQDLPCPHAAWVVGHEVLTCICIHTSHAQSGQFGAQLHSHSPPVIKPSSSINHIHRCHCAVISVTFFTTARLATHSSSSHQSISA